MMRMIFIALMIGAFLTQNLSAQTIKLSLRDSLIKDQLGDNKANPGDSIRYKLQLIISGDTAKMAVLDTTNFDASLTLDPSSIHVNPLARPDHYECVGNVGLNVLAANGLLTNDIDPDNKSGTITVTMAGYPAPMVAVATEFTSAKAGKVTVQANGTFVYSPAAGFSGIDSFYYEINDGDPVTANDKDLVTITVSNAVWFVNNASVATGSNGTLSNPFKTLEEMNTANAAGGASDPKDGDIIYISKGNADYTEGLNLRNGQKLYGQGASEANFSTLTGLSFPIGSATLPSPDGMAPVITNVVPPPLKESDLKAKQNQLSTSISESELLVLVHNGINLNQNNTIRGINIGNTESMAFKNSDMLSVGNLNIREVIISGTGGAMNISDGGALDVILTSVSTTSQTGSLLKIGPNSVTGDVEVQGGSASGVTGAVINISGGTANVTYKGNLTQANNASLVSVTSGHTGTLTFNTGTLSATNGDGLQFDNADGIYNFNGTTTLNGGDAGIDIVNGSGGSFTFGTGTSITSPSGIAYFEDNTSASITYAGTITQNTAQRAVKISNKSTNSSGFSGAILANTSSANGIELTSSSTATFTFSGGLDIDCTIGVGLNVDNAGTLNITGTNTIDKSGDGNALNINNTAAGASGVAFSSIRVTGGTGTAVNISSSSGTKNLGDVDVNRTGGGTAITINNGGTVNSSSGDINSGNSKAIDIDNTALGLVFTSVSCNGCSTGIDLNTTTGGFTVIGDNTNTNQGGNASGGTITNTTGDAIVLNNTTNVTLRRMTISNITDNAMQLTQANETYLEYCKIMTVTNSGVNGLGGSNVGFRFNNSICDGAGMDTNDDAFQFGETDQTDHLTGTVQFNNSLITNFYNKGVRIRNYIGTLNFTSSTSTYSNSTDGQGILLQADGPAIGGSGATINMTVSGSIFSNLRLEGIFANAIELGTNVTSTISNSSFNLGQTIAAIVVSNGLVLVSDNGIHKLNVKGNTFDNLATGIVISNNKDGKMEGNIGGPLMTEKNEFTNTNVSDAISIGAEGASGTGNISTIINVQNNAFDGPGDEGMEINNRGLGNTGGSMHVTVQDNIIGTAINPIADIGISSRSLDNSLTFITIRNNTLNVLDESMDLGAQNTSNVQLIVENNTITQPNDDLEVKNLDAFGETVCLKITGNNLTGGEIELTQIVGSTFNVEGGTAAISGNNNSAILMTTGTFGTTTCTTTNLPTN